MLDRNGYAPSIVEGWRDETEYTVRHEVYGGKNRQISKANGFWVAVSPMLHEMIHRNPNKGLDSFLKQYTQRIFERYATRNEFIKLIGKSYLTEPESQYKWSDIEPRCGAERMWSVENGAGL